MVASVPVIFEELKFYLNYFSLISLYGMKIESAEGICPLMKKHLGANIQMNILCSLNIYISTVQWIIFTQLPNIMTR